MSNLIQARNETAPVHVGLVGMLMCRTGIYLRPLGAALAALGRCVASLPAVVGEAASSAYVDPYMRNEKDRW